MQVLTFNNNTGVLLVCISNMISDLINWIKPTMLLTLAAGLVMHILAPAYRLDGTPGAFRLLRFGGIWDLDLDLSTSGPFFLPFWGLMGFFEPGELAAAPGSSFVAPFVLWIYLLIALVLFITIIIDANF